MQEIGTNVYIETDYAGVTLGLIKSGNGMILIDAPFLANHDMVRVATQLGGDPARLAVAGGAAADEAHFCSLGHRVCCLDRGHEAAGFNHSDSLLCHIKN